ncbi:uncharacterized protein LOC129950423 [Eupeodes corollae]|uniref:uncharacterized protein LOC129950423 n=1 Tax=Eupeodes corollae TaxID=290404 RepID=UPI00249148E7|nr:uncharacterized protein LOC129950423 [Eupeodes corollae]
MKNYKLLIVFTIQLIGLVSAKTESLSAISTVPFQLISPAEFKAISELSNGNPFITQKRLLHSGSEAVTNIINNIYNGHISPVNITGLESIYNSILNQPLSGPPQGYPFCAIQANRHNRHSQRSYDAVVDPASNFGTFSINFFHPGTVMQFDNYDEDITIDELEPDYHDQSHQKPSSYQPSESSEPSVAPPPPNNYGSSSGPDADKDRPDSSGAPVINCIVVLREPAHPSTTTPAPTTTPVPASTKRPSVRPPKRPSIYPQLSNILTSQQTLGQYQVVPIPYPPFLGLVGPSASGTPNWPTWPGSQAFASNTPNSAIPQTWPFLPVSNPSAIPSANKITQTVPTWPYLSIPSPAGISAHRVPSTPPFSSNSYWTSAINPDAPDAPSPSVSIYSKPNPATAVWLRPPTAGAFNANHLIPQPSQQNYNGNVNEELRSATHIGDEIASENKKNQVKTIIADANIVGLIQRSRSHSHHQNQQPHQELGVQSKD